MNGMAPKKLLMNISRELNHVNTCNDTEGIVGNMLQVVSMCDGDKKGAKILEWSSTLAI